MIHLRNSHCLWIVLESGEDSLLCHPEPESQLGSVEPGDGLSTVLCEKDTDKTGSVAESPGRRQPSSEKFGRSECSPVGPQRNASSVNDGSGFVTAEKSLRRRQQTSTSSGSSGRLERSPVRHQRNTSSVKTVLVLWDTRVHVDDSKPPRAQAALVV